MWYCEAGGLAGRVSVLAAEYTTARGCRLQPDCLLTSVWQSGSHFKFQLGGYAGPPARAAPHWPPPPAGCRAPATAATPSYATLHNPLVVITVCSTPDKQVIANPSDQTGANLPTLWDDRVNLGWLAVLSVSSGLCD